MLSNCGGTGSLDNTTASRCSTWLTMEPQWLYHLLNCIPSYALPYKWSRIRYPPRDHNCLLCLVNSNTRALNFVNANPSMADVVYFITQISHMVMFVLSCLTLTQTVNCLWYVDMLHNFLTRNQICLEYLAYHNREAANSVEYWTCRSVIYFNHSYSQNESTVTIEATYHCAKHAQKSWKGPPLQRTKLLPSC